MIELGINSCSGRLRSCIIAYPCHFDITVPINEKQRQNKGRVNKELAVKQYNEFINLIQSLGVRTYFLDLIPKCSYQVFTRDIGFVIGDVLFISKMGKNVRVEEVNILKAFLNHYGVKGKIYQLENNAEGGDIFVLSDFVLIGLGSRTKESAANEIKDVLTKAGIGKEVITLRFDVNKLHLDCVLGIINEETVVITPFLEKESIKVLKSLFKNLIEIDVNIANVLGSNFVPIDGETVVVTNREMEQVFKECGVRSIYVNYSEFVKAGGSVRCSILPLLRD